MLRCARETKLRQNMRSQFFVYILTNRPKGVLYVGVTSDLPRRLWEHRNKAAKGFTSAYGVVRLVYYEEHASILEARARERTLETMETRLEVRNHREDKSNLARPVR